MISVTPEVIVHEGKIIGRGYNRRNTDKSPLAHAEIAAIRKASKKLGDWRLEECTLYVTLEPCQMCAGAIIQSRIPRVVVGCMNPKAGCAGSVLDLLHIAQFNHQAELETAQHALQVLRAGVEGICPYTLPGDRQRIIVVVNKQAETSPQYPRRVGIPAKRPL